jgi:acylphosphatase
MPEPASSAVERREVHYRGHLQGVGFRYTVRHIAGQRRVTGFVRNLSDGRVHMVAEGERGELNGLLDEVALRMANYIREVTVDVTTATGEFATFDIRH